MNSKKDVNNCAFYYNVSMLRLLLSMRLITEEEYDRIIRICKEYYDVELYCV